MMDRWLPPSRRGSGYEYRAALTWETLDAIKAIAGLPFILKGVATAEDAVIAVEHGANTIYVSNHGGRQLDHGRATIDMLPEIVQAVGGGAQIIIDGGIVRGSDVLKAIALGATAVAIGKLQGWGLAAAGQLGLVRVLELLERDYYQHGTSRRHPDQSTNPGLSLSRATPGTDSRNERLCPYAGRPGLVVVLFRLSASGSLCGVEQVVVVKCFDHSSNVPFIAAFTFSGSVVVGNVDFRIQNPFAVDDRQSMFLF
jgi:FMN-dependent dehydrogenase